METGNVFDPFAVSVEECGNIVSHVPRKSSVYAGWVGLYNDLDNDGTEFYQQHW